MTMTTPSRSPVDRSERMYRRLLVVYPREFQREYGEDLVQAFRDLMMLSTDGRGMWWRTTRDLVSSAARERSSTFSGDRKPSAGVIFVLVATVVAAVIVGSGPFLPLVLVVTALMIGLPIHGINRLRRAWLIRRTTGGTIKSQIGLGLLSFVPAAVVLALLKDDAGYLIFATLGLTLIVGSGLGTICAIAMLVAAGRGRLAGRQWVRPALMLIAGVAILGSIIGASYNSYRQSLGPAGDHSVENASADTRDLWQAAYDGDVDEVVSLTSTTCADPWVKFPVGNGRHNAKGQAEARELELPDRLEPPFREISGILGDYMDDWHHRCPATG